MGKFTRKVQKSNKTFNFNDKKAVSLTLPMDKETLSQWVNKAQEMTKEKGSISKPLSLLYISRWISDSLAEKYDIGTSYTMTVGEEMRPGGVIYLEGVVGCPAHFTEEFDGIFIEYGYSMSDLFTAAEMSSKLASAAYGCPANMGHYSYYHSYKR